MIEILKGTIVLFFGGLVILAGLYCILSFLFCSTFPVTCFLKRYFNLTKEV
jgi:hypothetical protein